MDRSDGNDLNDRLRDDRMSAASGRDLGGTPQSDATSESLLGDTMHTGGTHASQSSNLTGERIADRMEHDSTDRRHHDANPGDEVGEAVGGISGVLTGAALGSLGGPVGTIIGGIAGAVSGWWAGRAISEAASHATDDDDSVYREHYTGAGRADRQYDDVRPAYHLGHIAGRNPDYQGRQFDEIETDLRHGWTGDVSQRHGDWNEVRDYARHAYERGRSGTSGSTGGFATSGAGTSGNATHSAHAGMGGTGLGTGGGVGDALTHGAVGGAMGAGLAGAGMTGSGTSGVGHHDSLAHTGDRIDHTLDRVGDRTEHAADRAGHKIEHAADRTGNAIENAWDKTKDAVRHAGEKVGDALDDTKDRVDGNPASRPGIDRTDSSDRLR
jgi:gas vesicle protein